MQQRNIPEWLKTLQENSWELELLISGGAIFSLFQISDFYLNWIDSIGMLAPIPGRVFMLLVGLIGIKILTLGFIIHLSLRAYWLALVCINFVYPNGINTDKIKWKNPFKSTTNNGDDLQDQITYVDKQCGTVMFMSIISIFVILGLLLVFAFLIGLLILIKDNDNVIATIGFIFFIIYVFDLLSFGLLRKIPLVSYIIYPIFKFFDIISFRSYYAKALLMFNTNVVKWKFLLKATLFAIVAITTAYLNSYKTMHWPNLFDKREYRWQMANNDYLSYSSYMDEWKEDKVYKIGISSKIQEGNLMELFVTYHHRYDDLIEQTSLIDSLRTFDKILQVQLDSNIIENLNWHPTSKSNSLIGITSMIPINTLKEGSHTLIVSSKVKYLDEYREAEAGGYKVIIPFWIDRSKNN